jgi:hypothetical protein
VLDSLVRQRLEEAPAPAQYAPAEYANAPARDKGETRSLSHRLVDCCIAAEGRQVSSLRSCWHARASL